MRRGRREGREREGGGRREVKKRGRRGGGGREGDKRGMGKWGEVGRGGKGGEGGIIVWQSANCTVMDSKPK